MGFLKFCAVFLTFWTVFGVIAVAAVSGPEWLGLLIVGGVFWFFGGREAWEKQRRKREHGRWVQ